jgi:hypothetical protein
MNFYVCLFVGSSQVFGVLRDAFSLDFHVVFCLSLFCVLCPMLPVSLDCLCFVSCAQCCLFLWIVHSWFSPNLYRTQAISWKNGPRNPNVYDYKYSSFIKPSLTAINSWHRYLNMKMVHDGYVQFRNNPSGVDNFGYSPIQRP